MRNKFNKIFSILLLIILNGLLSSCNFCKTIEEIRKCFSKKTQSTVTVNANVNQYKNKAIDENKNLDKDHNKDLQMINFPKSKEEQALTIAMLECLANKEEDVYAMYRLGEIYLNGFLCVEQDPIVAYNWFYKAAIRGFSKAMWQLGNMYLAGIGTNISTVKAIDWYKDAAQLGNIQAMLALGYLYKGGYLNTPDYHKSIHWYSKAASMGSYEAEYQMAQLIEQGLVEKKKYPINMNIAVNSFIKAAGQGDPEAMLMLAEHYLNIKEYSLSLMYYQQAAKQNFTPAILRLGLLYLHGEIIPRDYLKAIDLLTQAANLGEVNAEYYLGEIYNRGLGVPVNMKLSAYWYTKASNKNFTKSLVKLGDLYFSGKGMEPNLYKAI
ncbi:MAG: SEL1-like repeat protein, partial [Gammaproteobacteria bacterium]